MKRYVILAALLFPLALGAARGIGRATARCQHFAAPSDPRSRVPTQRSRTTCRTSTGASKPRRIAPIDDRNQRHSNRARPRLRRLRRRRRQPQTTRLVALDLERTPGSMMVA
jgi:hypothetical protein